LGDNGKNGSNKEASDISQFSGQQHCSPGADNPATPLKMASQINHFT